MTRIHRTRVGRGAVTVASAMLTAAPALAQSGRTAARTATETRPSLSSACTLLMNAPSDLVRTPEGVALYRFKRELEGLASIFESRSPAGPAEARKMSVVRRGVDSLLQVFVRSHSGDGAPGPTISIQRGDSSLIVNGRPLDGRVTFESLDMSDANGRKRFEFTIRSLEPQVSAMTSAGARIVRSGSSSGYLGVSLSGSQMRMVTDSGAFTAHCEYPMIEAVDVGSPARVAGLGAGDTVLAYNGRDIVAQTVNYPQLLVPGKVVRVRVRRDGKMRELPVTVGERTVAIDNVPAMEIPGRRVPGQSMYFVPAAPSRADRTGSIEFVRGAPVSGAVSPRAAVGSAVMVSLFGAQLYAVEQEFAQNRRVDPGVMVMKVQAGSPAAEAGLRAGEMIRAVNGVPVRDLATLQRLAETSGVREVRLTVWGGENPVRIVTVRW